MFCQTGGVIISLSFTRAGIGKELALAALARGDQVIATGRERSLAKLDELQSKGAATLELDVTSSLDTLHAAAKKAIAIYGRVDVLVNNAGESLGSIHTALDGVLTLPFAGYVHVGTIEESTPQETLNQFK